MVSRMRYAQKIEKNRPTPKLYLRKFQNRGDKNILKASWEKKLDFIQRIMKTHFQICKMWKNYEPCTLSQEATKEEALWKWGNKLRERLQKKGNQVWVEDPERKYAPGTHQFSNQKALVMSELPKRRLLEKWWMVWGQINHKYISKQNKKDKLLIPGKTSCSGKLKSSVYYMTELWLSFP